MKRVVMLICLILFCLGVTMPVEAQHPQQKEIKMELRNERLPQALKRLEKLSGYKILFSYDDLNQFTVGKSKFVTTSIRSALGILLSGKPVTYSIDGQYININIKESAVRSTKKQNDRQTGVVTYRGQVTDKDGLPLMGATVIHLGPNLGYVTDDQGRFTVVAPKGKLTSLRFSFVGMKSVTRSFNGHKSLSDITVVLEDDATIDEVVINGMFERKKESFTGASTTFNKEQLLQAGNQNLVKSLKNLDPAFQINENLDMGSNPNAMPNIQMRGQTSFNIQGDYQGNANEPLFILDGFETTLEKVWDLDMNRVQSVTLLKDAAAKAIYGSKAGNGVVVIETIRPKTGQMRISYNGDLNLEVPDLTGYNLMNAKEKLNWEVEHHKYDNWMSFVNPEMADLLYKSVYDAIASGVDTYWLSKPLQSGLGQKHSLSLEGGDSRIRYILGITYNNVTGVMKGSDRNTFNINSTLSYTYKNMVFRNQIDYTRNFSKNSPYGSFSDYVKLEPYFAPYDSNGKLKKILGYETVSMDTFENPVFNPLYNATLNTMDESQYTSFTDNFDMDWHINQNFRFTGRFSYTYNENRADQFYPSGHTMFIFYDDNGMGDRKGLYTKTNGYSQTINAQAGLNYNKTFGLHSLFLNGTWNVHVQNTGSTTVMAEGFGNDSMGDISMANYYYHDSHPMGTDSKTREIGLIGAFNYSYADRYLVDLSYRATGSSVYGSDNHWGGFWSAGAGWNIHKEKFFPQNSIVKLLKLRYSLGYTGTQNFNPYQARARYHYNTVYYDGRLGAILLALPNSKLKWQKVYDNNLGLDIALGSFLSGRFEYYVQNTTNMLSDITMPGSTGFPTYKENMGEIQNKGVEFTLGVTPWRNAEHRGWLTFTASLLHNKNKIRKIYDIFKKSNDDADANFEKNRDQFYDDEAAWNSFRAKQSRPATKYYEGVSMTAIWGMRSLGVDPMTGKEMFLDKNGKPTYTWSKDDQVVIGDTNPKIRGTLGISAGWDGFTLSLAASYKLGGDLYNTTLVDRVENVNGYGNLDRRVSQTWTKPGDNAAFRAITMGQAPYESTDITKPTSRFVQKDNELYISTINLSYDFYKMKWVRKIGLERFRLGFYTTELARFSTIKVERGLDYPFARTFSFSVNATF